MRLFKKQTINNLFSERALKVITDLKTRDISSFSKNHSNSSRDTLKKVKEFVFLLLFRNYQFIKHLHFIMETNKNNLQNFFKKSLYFHLRFPHIWNWGNPLQSLQKVLQWKHHYSNYNNNNYKKHTNKSLWKPFYTNLILLNQSLWFVSN